MFVGLFAALAGLSLAGVAQAQQTAWGQCGGNGWTGKTTCISGYYCSVLNPWYSQCIPGTAPGGSTSTSSSSRPTVDTSVSLTSTPTQTISSSAPTITGGQSTNPSSGKQIRTVVDPVYHLYLQLVNGKPQLGPESQSGYFVYGTTVGLVMADGSKLYLNLGTSSTSYKPLTFDTTATTTTWNLSGDTFRVGQLQNFLACSAGGGYWDLYLQTGNDTPTGRTCANYITIHLPCLC